MMNNEDNILLVGAGHMAMEYAKVLRAINLLFIVVGRGQSLAKAFERIVGVKVAVGGIEKWLKGNKHVPKRAIVAVNVDQLATTTKKLIASGVGEILLEKPGGLTSSEIKSVAVFAKQRRARVFIAYNRRFYSSVIKACEIIQQDKGVESFTFDFTEWNHQIADLQMLEIIKNHWFLANSSHVVDLAFFLGGKPRKMNSFRSGSLKWHPAGSVFSGAGITKLNAPFSYSANWSAPGRWGVEVFTSKSKLIFRPLEKLQIMRLGSIAINEVEIDDRLDRDFKPGLYRQVKSFISDKKNLLTIDQQVENLKYYKKIAGY